MYKIILDTNIFLSAFVFSGLLPQKIINLVIEKKLQLCTSANLKKEVFRKLSKLEAAPKGKLTIVSEGYIKDNSNNANLQAWDTSNGILFYSAKGYTTTANGATYTGVIYAPTTQINGAFSNTTFNGSLYSKTVSFGSGTSLTAKQAAGFPTAIYPLPL